jgi:hypothetical protein
VLHAARARGRAGADLDLAQDGVLPRGETHVARQRQFAARPAGPATLAQASRWGGNLERGRGARPCRRL